MRPVTTADGTTTCEGLASPCNLADSTQVGSDSGEISAARVGCGRPTSPNLGFVRGAHNHLGSFDRTSARRIEAGGAVSMGAEHPIDTVTETGQCLGRLIETVLAEVIRRGTVCTSLVPRRRSISW